MDEWNVEEQGAAWGVLYSHVSWAGLFQLNQVIRVTLNTKVCLATFHKLEHTRIVQEFSDG